MLHRLLNASPLKPDGVTYRGREVSRLEAFSDAVFGFAITLLVVSLDVPYNYTELMDRMSGWLAFAVCFVLLVQFWFKHYMFFRRFGLSDMTTVVLNSALLFVLLLYIYPLKYIFSLFFYTVLHVGPAAIQQGLASLTTAHVRTMFALYGFGFLVVYLLYAALYVHAFRMREHLKLSRLELFDTRDAIGSNAAIASIGLVSLVMSQLLPDRFLQLSGWVYIMTGPVATVVGTVGGTRRKKLEQALARQ
jgi:uncharacterized membrane protein